MKFGRSGQVPPSDLEAFTRSGGTNAPVLNRSSAGRRPKLPRCSASSASSPMRCCATNRGCRKLSRWSALRPGWPYHELVDSRPHALSGRAQRARSLRAMHRAHEGGMMSAPSTSSGSEGASHAEGSMHGSASSSYDGRRRGKPLFVAVSHDASCTASMTWRPSSCRPGGRRHDRPPAATGVRSSGPVHHAGA